MRTEADPERVGNISDVHLVFSVFHCLVFVLLLANEEDVIAYFCFRRIAEDRGRCAQHCVDERCIRLSASGLTVALSDC